MNINIEQAKTLEAVARLGSLLAAARELKKTHTAILYTMRSLETALDLKLLDRSGYRATLTAHGSRVLSACHNLLASARELEQLASMLRAGWEPSLKIVFDGLLPLPPIIAAARELRRLTRATRIELYSEFLSGVEERFAAIRGDLMLGILPPNMAGLRVMTLPKLRSLLVVHRDHPAARGLRHKLSRSQLITHTFLTVRGSDERLSLSTLSLDEAQTIHLSDFAAKKLAIMGQAGFGWLPEHLIKSELETGELVLVRWQGASEHLFQPQLFWHGPDGPRPAAQAFISAYVDEAKRL